ncbi:MAG TPA: flagellar hook capping FlgD N-terminal domain-containing protein [Burkholderiaceae bacterium]|jgi:flagellar basal-body rod modification protein FlgD|nr:flagellar hook capping FlgD N-terminal domain-containing protein [Burkholderiaceae bacterium]
MTVSTPSTLASLLQQTSSTGATGTNSGANGTSAQSLSDTFLKLLVAQMNNQDPLNPVDNSQVTSQMAQISTVTGISSLNTTVSQLVSQLQQSQALQSTQLSGHTVLVPGNSLTLASTAASGSSSTQLAAYGGFSLAQAADTVSVTVKDSTGATVRTINLGALGTGVQDFSWDGTTDSGAKAAAGSYSYSVTAKANGQSVTTTAYSAQQVVGEAPQSDGSLKFLLSNGSQVGFGSIAQIL